MQKRFLDFTRGGLYSGFSGMSINSFHLQIKLFFFPYFSILNSAAKRIELHYFLLFLFILYQQWLILIIIWYGKEITINMKKLLLIKVILLYLIWIKHNYIFSPICLSKYIIIYKLYLLISSVELVLPCLVRGVSSTVLILSSLSFWATMLIIWATK